MQLEEREEISRGLAAGLSYRAFANSLGRPASTVSREVAVNGGAKRYRAAPVGTPWHLDHRGRKEGAIGTWLS